MAHGCHVSPPLPQLAGPLRFHHGSQGSSFSNDVGGGWEGQPKLIPRLEHCWRRRTPGLLNRIWVGQPSGEREGTCSTCAATQRASYTVTKINSCPSLLISFHALLLDRKVLIKNLIHIRGTERANCVIKQKIWDDAKDWENFNYLICYYDNFTTIDGEKCLKHILHSTHAIIIMPALVLCTLNWKRYVILCVFSCSNLFRVSSGMPNSHPRSGFKNNHCGPGLSLMIPRINSLLAMRYRF